MRVHAQVPAGPATRELSLLGLRVVLEAERADQLAGLLEVYQSVPAGGSGATLAGRLAAPDACTALLELPGLSVVGRGETPRAAGAATAFALFHAAARAAVDQLVIHAAALHTGAGVLLLVAPSGVGKTTLAASLALRGAGFLSDEAGAIDRTSGLAQPVPRAIGIRPGPLAEDPRLAAALAAAVVVDERGGRRKWLVDLVASGLARIGAPAPVREVVFLRPSPSGPAAVEPVDWLLDIDRPAPGLASRLAAIAGVLSARPDGGVDEPRIVLTASPGARLNRAVDDACEAAGVVAVRLVEAAHARPDFSAVPILAPMSASAGLLELARHVENGARSSLLDGELGGRPGLLVMELARLLGGARFWRLSCGELGAMCDLLERLP